MQRELTAAEVSELTARHYDLGARVLAHKALVASGGWSQVDVASTGTIALFRLPIPPNGHVVTDDKFGAVIVFPDAAGRLHYNANVSTAAVGAVNLPPYESPSGNAITESLADLKAAAERFGKLLVVGLVVVGCFWVVVHR